MPKGLIGDHEDELTAAAREFKEEVGITVAGVFTRLKDAKQRSGKIILCWLVEADLDLTKFRSNTFVMEWPRSSGEFQELPECDRAAYFPTVAALSKVVVGQRPLIREADALMRQRQSDELMRTASDRR